MWEAIERLQQGESLNIQDVNIEGFTLLTVTRFYKLMNEMIRNNLTVTTMQVNVQFLQQLHQNGQVNELRAERLARNANPLALVATAQADQDQYYQTSRSHRSFAPSSKSSIPTRSHTTTRHKGNKIAKPITPPSETASEDDNDPEQAQRDKDMQKNLTLIAKYFKKIYKPTNNNLRTSSNSKNKNVDTTPWFKNDNQSGHFGNQKTVNVVAARENVGSKVMQQSGIQCFNCREFGHFAKECRKPKRVKDFVYHKEKMLLCKQAEQGVPLQAEQYDWLADTDEEVDEQELKAHYSYMAKIQEVPTADLGTDLEPMEQDDIQNEQNDVESDDERVALANLIANLKLDVDENKKIQKQLKKANTTLAQELKECKTILAKTSKSLGSILVSEIVAWLHFRPSRLSLRSIRPLRTVPLIMINLNGLLTKSRYKGLVKQKTKVITNLKLREEHDIEKMLSMEKQLKFLNEVVYKRSQSIQTIHMMAPKVSSYNGRPTLANPRYLKQAQSEIPCLYAFPYDQSTHANKLIPDREETLALERESRSKLNKDLVRTYATLLSIVFMRFLNPQPRNQFRAPTAQDIKILIQTCLMPLAIKTQNDSFKFVHELKQEMHADLKYVESFEKEIDELESDKAEFSDMYDIKSIPKANVSEGLSKPVTTQTLPQTARQAVSNINVLRPGMKSTCFVRDLQGNDLLTDADVPSQQELDLLFGPLYDEFFNAGSNLQDKQPSSNIPSTSVSSTPTNVHAEENNDNQAEGGEQLQDDEFNNPFCAPTHDVAESSSHKIGNSNVPTFNQLQVSKYQWMKDHPVEQVRENPSRPVQTRRQLATDPEMYMYALTVNTTEPKNIKEAMADLHG
nr:hypothetical protein [Tanacetum cinerariifolium]